MQARIGRFSASWMSSAAGGLNGMRVRSVPEGYICGEDAVRMAVRVLASRAEHWGSPCSGPDMPAIRTRDTAGASPVRNAVRAARVDALVKKIGFLSFG